MEANQDCMVSFHDWCFYFASEKKYDAVKKGCRINSAVFRGNVAHLPKQFMTVLNEDTFLFNCYRKVGSFEYVDGLKPSVARIHGNNIWGESDSNNILQVMHRVNTKLNFLSAIKATKTNVVEISSLPGLIYKAWPESNCFIRSREFFPFVMVGVFLWPIVYLARKIRGALNA